MRRLMGVLSSVAVVSVAGSAQASTSTVVHVSQPLYWVQGTGTTGAGTPIDGVLSQRVDGAQMDVVADSGGASMTVVTNGLVPSRAYTMWFTFFNHPEECVHSPAPGLRCGLLDLFNAAADGSLVYGDGLVATGSGDRFEGHRPVGEAPEGDPAEMIALGTGVLTNPLGAEYQVTLRGHGPWDPDTYGDAQIRTLERRLP